MIRGIFLFLTALLLPFFVNAGVIVNEVAWMGTANSAQDEWVELTSDSSQNLDGWTLLTSDGGMNITLSGTISAGGFYLMERTDDTTVPNITADLVTPFGNGLSNTGEILLLKDAGGNTIDTVDASDGWPAGDNATKETMQKSEGGWTTAPGTPKAQNVGSSSQNSSESSGEEDEAQTSEQSQNNNESSQQNNSAGLIDKKQFRAEIASDAIAIVGVAKTFYGKGYDINGEPITNADFLWNFGDGAMARGQNVSHTFYYPGSYRVVFDVSSGVYNASDTLTVKGIPAPISISEIKPGTGGFIELLNDAEYEIDISYWGIGNGTFVYYFPQDTFMLPRSYLVIPYAVSSIEFLSFGEASLLYPNNALADELTYGAVPKSDESFHTIGSVSRLGLESPGSGKFVARQAAQPISDITNQAAVRGTQNNIQETNAVAGVAQSNDISTDEMRQIASPVGSSGRFYQSFWFWLGMVLVIGFLSAGGVLIIRRLE